MKNRLKYLVIFLLCLGMTACNTPVGPDNTKNSDEVPADVASRMHKSPKRGIAFNLNRTDDAQLLTPYISWDYNWGVTCAEGVYSLFMTDNGVDFCPMAWNDINDATLDAWCAAHPETRYLLAYNEPNLTDQANMTPQQAAAKWPKLKSAAVRNNLKIIAPAMNYGTLAGYSDPEKWYDEFFQLIPIDDVAGLSVHCYMASPSALQGYIRKFEKYNKPIWLTEFCAWDPVPSSVDAQIRYMCNALNWLEMYRSVERYAWFIPRAGMPVTSAPYMQLLTPAQPSELTDLGKIYCQLSSFDRSVWLDTRMPVRACEYVDVLDSTVQVLPSGEEFGFLKVDMAKPKWTEYQVWFPSGVKALELRYSSPVNTQFVIYIDGEYAGNWDAPKTTQTTDENWVTLPVEADFPQGKHSMRIEILKGGFDLVWFWAK